jgi:hypothetical protein
VDEALVVGPGERGGDAADEAHGRVGREGFRAQRGAERRPGEERLGDEEVGGARSARLRGARVDDGDEAVRRAEGRDEAALLREAAPRRRVGAHEGHEDRLAPGRARREEHGAGAPRELGADLVGADPHGGTLAARGRSRHSGPRAV